MSGAGSESGTGSVVWLARLLPFWCWVAWFLCAWTVVVIAGGRASVVIGHWPIAVAMAAGSYVAGSTPMGGGTVGFPVLVLLLGEAPTLGRDFSLCVQSVGMSSATMFLLVSRAPIAWPILRWSLMSSVVVTPLGLVLVAPVVPELAVALTFACIWAAFGLMTLHRLRPIVAAHGSGRLAGRSDMWLGLGVGVAGGIATAVTGVGIDMLLYCVLVLVHRCDLRRAIATSVVVMAANSLVGAVASAALGRLGPDVFHHWLAAAPIVLLGAPLGALMMMVVPRTVTLIFVSLLCVGQFVAMCVSKGVGDWRLAAALVAVVGLNVVFAVLYRLGTRLHFGEAPPAVAPAGNRSSVAP